MLASQSPAPLTGVVPRLLKTYLMVLEVVPVIVLAPVSVPPEASSHADEPPVALSVCVE